MKIILILIGLLFGLYTCVNAHLNIYLNQQEVMRLLGLQAELYYVREGQVNEYALQFQVPVPANIKDVTFTWQSLAPKPLPYSIHISSSDPQVLPRPSMNISTYGEIPNKPETFAISLKCTGIRPAEVEISISVEITLNRVGNNVTELVFRRKKICLQGDMDTFGLNDQLQQDSSTPTPSGIITFAIGGILAVLLVCVLIVVAYCARRSPVKRTTHPIRTSSFQRLPAHPPSVAPSIAPTVTTLPRSNKMNPSEPEEQLRRIAELTVQKCRVRLSSLLLEGTFGRVYKGTYNDNQDVLVKTVGHANQQQVSLLLQEGMSLYGASHAGILSLLGVSIEDNTAPFLLYPAPNNTRNLKLFLQEPMARSLTTIQIVLMSTQIAEALAHLHNHGVIHRDVAARNCVIDNQLLVKLADYSLSRDLFPADYHCLGDNENRPIKWLALEAIQRRRFSEVTDTWAFGVLMWELCTLARQPYGDIDPFQMEHYLREGYRLAQPVNCPDELFTIMAYCWAMTPNERPNFLQLQMFLQEFYSQITRYV